MTAEMRAARLHKPGEPLDGAKTRPGGLVNIVVNPDR
jgi:hypothetical protein